MDSRFSDICVNRILVPLAAFAGCTSAPAQHGATAAVSVTFITPEKTVPAEMEPISHTTVSTPVTVQGMHCLSDTHIRYF